MPKETPLSLPPWVRQLTRDSGLGALSGLMGGIFTTVILLVFGDDLRDAAIWLRTWRAPHHVLLLYDPTKSGPSVHQKFDAAYNLYGIRDNDSLEGIFGKRNPDATTDFDISFNFKGFSRDGFVYFSYSPSHTERYGSGQFQSVERYDRDMYVGLMMAQVCDADGRESRQRVMIAVLTRTVQQQNADEAASHLMTEPLAPLYAMTFSHRECKLTSELKSR